MSKGKYIIPVIMGRPGRDLYLVNCSIPSGRDMVLVRHSVERAITPRDIKAIERLVEPSEDFELQHKRLNELSPPEDILDSISRHEATLVQGYINNILPGAFKAKELNNWFIYDKQGDLTPLKLARFAINLLERSDRKDLLGVLFSKNNTPNDSIYDQYK